MDAVAPTAGSLHARLSTQGTTVRVSVSGIAANILFVARQAALEHAEGVSDQ